VGVEDADESPASIGGNDPGDGVYPADTIVERVSDEEIPQPIKLACVAGPKSPLTPCWPLPATVAMVPVAASTLRMRLFPVSAIKHCSTHL
jgi:hypothetical protein